MQIDMVQSKLMNHVIKASKIWHSAYQHLIYMITLYAFLLQLEFAEMWVFATFSW